MWIHGCLLAAAAWLGEDTRPHLEALSAGSIEERAAAETWLTRHLELDDFALLAEFVGTGSAEARARIAQALGANDAHIELAALLSADDAPQARIAGDTALRQMVRRWSGASQLAPKGGDDLWEPLEGRFEGVFALDLRAGVADELFDRLARHAPLWTREGGVGVELAITIDPPLFEAATRIAGSDAGAVRHEPQWGEGTFDHLLRECVTSQKLAIGGFGLDGTRPWLWLHATPGDGELNGADLLRHWCRSVVLGRERVRGEGAARALAQSGWPAPLPWFARAWRERGDRSALAGLLVAAARGRIAPELVRAEEVQRLLGEFERRERESRGTEWRRFAQEFSVALERFPPVDGAGNSLSDLVARWAERADASADAKLAAQWILAGMRNAPDAWRGGALERLRTESSSPAALWNSLRLAAALQREAREAWTLAAPAGFVEYVLARRSDRQVIAWSEQLRASPPLDRGRRDAAKTFEPAARAFWIEWGLGAGASIDALAPWVREWAEDGAAVDVLGRTLAGRVELGDGARVAELIDAASSGAEGASKERLQRMGALAGVTPLLERQRMFEALSAKTPIAASDWPVLGALARFGTTPAYCEFVLEHAKRAAAVDKSLDAPWIAAFEDAMRGARGRGERELAERMRRELWVVVRRNGHPLQPAMEREEWPPQPGPAPLVLDALDPQF